MRVLNNVQREIKLKNCQSGKHKIRQNNFGVSWCVYCGLLSNADSEPLQEDDKILYIK